MMRIILWLLLLPYNVLQGWVPEITGSSSVQRPTRVVSLSPSLVVTPLTASPLNSDPKRFVSTTSTSSDDDTSEVGTVIRLATRAYHKDHSKPSSRSYTTRKDEREAVPVTTQGVGNDYNHYRTLALKSTPDRAVSLWTTDLLPNLQAAKYPVQVGDLGENISIDGVPYTFFEIGQQYQIGSEVVVEITEPMEPCANLCKLPYINDSDLKPVERIEKCQAMLELLAQVDGMRGWYAKVIQEGTTERGDKVIKLSSQEEKEGK